MSIPIEDLSPSFHVTGNDDTPDRHQHQTPHVQTHDVALSALLEMEPELAGALPPLRHGQTGEEGTEVDLEGGGQGRGVRRPVPLMRV